MTKFRTTAIAAVAAVTIAASMAATPAQALSKKGAFWAGVGTAAFVGAAAAAAHSHNNYYGHGGYSERRAYRRAARRCARRWGWHTWRWERCMDRRGF